ncbi:MAG: extracellular solute-binding protein [Actinobacteria bacterium]|nr:extracellular solute-binding protein [Actinomycetota bacterium]MDQ3533058.1 extracellular solute-binding protein [Actinomycetota bacterium]
MYFRRRRSLVICLLTVLCALTIACNPGAEDEDGADGSQPAQQVNPETLEGELTVWGFGTEDVIGANRIEQFEEAYPKVKVKLTPGEFDNQKFLSAAASGSPPDVIHVDRTIVGSFAARGALISLDDYIDATNLDTGIYYDSAMEQVTVDGSVYGIPQFSNVVVAILNNTAMKEAGLTAAEVDFSDWEDLQKINEQLSKVDGDKVVRVGFDAGLPGFTPFWSAANGGPILNEDGTESMLDSPEVIEAVDFAAETREPVGGQEKYLGFSQSWDFFGSSNMYVRDQIGIGLFEQWYVGVLGDVSPDVDITVRPFTTHEDGDEISYSNGLAWAIPEGAGDTDAAFEFMKFMTDTDTWVAAAEASKKDIESKGGVYTGTYTANNEADERIFEDVYEPTGDKSFDDAVKVILDAQDAAVSTPPSAAGEEVMRAWEDASNKVLLGELSAEEAMKEADEIAQRALDEASEDQG